MGNSDKDESIASKVNVMLQDPLGKGIEGLKYQIKHGAKVVAQGVTDGQGKIAAFASEVGAELSLQVERFATGEMKHIRTLVPWADQFSVKLVSGKVKEKVDLKKDAGSAGEYKRKTYTIEPGDTLGKIAVKKSTTAQALADLNGLKLTDTIYPGAVLKLPPEKGAAGAPPAAPPPPAPAATPPVTPAESHPAASPVTPSDPPAAHSPAAHSAPKAAPLPPLPPKVPSRPPEPPVVPKKEESRGESGTPKTTANLECKESGCIKLGDKGPLIEEINIRLTGFGGTVMEGHEYQEFTSKTEAAVKKFQRDYMGVAETGKVCGRVLRALDDFLQKYPVSFSGMHCVNPVFVNNKKTNKDVPCAKCAGFGNRLKVMHDYGKYKPKVPGIENPGIHRSLIWALRAVLFYIKTKDSELGYTFLRISSGYRCTYNNFLNSRATTNHMGNALDIQFKRHNGPIRCEGHDVDELRKNVFIKRIGAQLGWAKKNTLSMESAAEGAKSWVHVDCREFEPAFCQEKYYATTPAAADGGSLLAMAIRENRNALANCGGIPLSPLNPARPASPAHPASPVAGNAGRLPIAGLSPSTRIRDFIKGYEAPKGFDPTPYNDPKGYCTIGFGHLIDGHNRCEVLAKNRSEKYLALAKGIDLPKAESIFTNDMANAEAVVKRFIKAPLYQHEYDALVSLAYNCGNNFHKFKDLIAAANTYDYKECCHQFADITSGNMPGLVTRRQAEMNIFSKAIYNSKH